MLTLQFKGRVFVENRHFAVPFDKLFPFRDKGLSEKASLHDYLIVEGDKLPFPTTCLIDAASTIRLDHGNSVYTVPLSAEELRAGARKLLMDEA